MSKNKKKGLRNTERRAKYAAQRGTVRNGSREHKRLERQIEKGEKSGERPQSNCGFADLKAALEKKRRLEEIESYGLIEDANFLWIIPPKELGIDSIKYDHDTGKLSFHDFSGNVYVGKSVFNSVKYVNYRFGASLDYRVIEGILKKNKR